MNARAALLICVVVLAAAGAAWWVGPENLPFMRAGANEPDDPGEALPIPPVPPRIADGADYEHCLAMINDDPDGADSFAEAWEATGGGEGATHCHALAQVALGNADDGAEMLEKLAGSSAAPPLARASVWGQAGQAWMIADKPDRAYAAATQALILSPDDPDLLIDRSVNDAQLERFDDAVEDLSRALDLDPRRADALVLRGAAWRHLNHADLAADDVDRALMIEPESPEALLERGILRQRRGDRSGAREDWSRAATLAPDTATADLAQQNLELLEAGPERR